MPEILRNYCVTAAKTLKTHTSSIKWSTTKQICCFSLYALIFNILIQIHLDFCLLCMTVSFSSLIKMPKDIIICVRILHVILCGTFSEINFHLPSLIKTLNSYTLSNIPQHFVILNRFIALYIFYLINLVLKNPP